jgi:dTDP-glucose 4,6-dehydratase
MAMSESRMRAAQRRDVSAILERELPWDRLSGQRVLVTGASGFLGGYLARTLLALHPLRKVERPVHVTAMVRNMDKAALQLADLRDDPHLTLQQHDLRQLPVPDLGSCNYVLHAASQASPRYYGTTVLTRLAHFCQTRSAL